MTTDTNIDAQAVRTITWLQAPGRSIVVPVYQRQYRWDIGGCEQLLRDVRAVAESEADNLHFIGSVLSSVSASNAGDELVLIDGQQRITTLMLLVAAVQHTIAASDAALAEEIGAVLLQDGKGSAPTLRPHSAWAEVFERVVLDLPLAAGEERNSRFDDNYAFFRSQISADEAPLIWRGLQKLEHVAISLGAHANAQQIFESLNSTGEPLRDHELIHNYVLMGLTHEQQREIEDEFWMPIERATGESIAAFWRHLLIMRTGRELATVGERGVYDAFRSEFPRLDIETLREQATEWREYAGIYETLLDPRSEQDAEIAEQLRYLHTFGSGLFPLVMRAYFDYTHDRAGKNELIETVELVQSLLFRRTVVGVPTDRLVARLCRARHEGHDELVAAFSRIMPSDERVRVALKFSPLPFATYVLGRVLGVSDLSEVDVEHIVPAAPGDDWSPDGHRRWAELSDDEQNSYRALSETLGNLTLLEQDLSERVFDASFPTKKSAYAKSSIDSTRLLESEPEWRTGSITRRTVALSDAVLKIWKRPTLAHIDDDGLTPILDAKKRRGWPAGWQREWDYTEYRGEHWEIYDIKSLFHRIFQRLWADSRESVVAYVERNGGPIYRDKAWNGQWDDFSDGVFLYMGWDSRYMLSAVQGVLEEAGIAAEVFVKYSYIGDAMRS